MLLGVGFQMQWLVTVFFFGILKHWLDTWMIVEKWITLFSFTYYLESQFNKISYKKLLQIVNQTL